MAVPEWVVATSLCQSVGRYPPPHEIWSHEIVVLDGVTTTMKVAYIRLCQRRMMFVRAYPRETQEMVFDAHERACAFFRGATPEAVTPRDPFPTP